MKKQQLIITPDDLKSLPVFITTMSRWDNEISSASLALAKVLSRTNKVYYFDYPYTFPDILRGRKDPTVKRRLPALLFGKDPIHPIPGQSANLKAVTPRAVFPFNFLSPGWSYELGGHINNKILASAIKKVARKEGIQNYILLNSFSPNYLWNTVNYVDPVVSIYHSRDEIGTKEYTARHGIRNELNCIRNYDLAIATSTELCRKLSEKSGNKVHYFPNGGDITLFRTAIDKSLPKPVEMQSISTPIIGYTGAVCQRIDYELLVKIARRHSDKTIVMVGPRLDKKYTTINLDEIPNIVFTGPKKIDELPAYLQYFDCAIIPFVKDVLTKSIYPLKINEYLAAGRSVVTTDFSEDINSFAPYIHLTKDHDSFLDAIDDAILANSAEDRQKRLNASLGNSWEKRVELFWQMIWETWQEKAQLERAGIRYH
jgi:teichuronic acid biosynthesis glycosyltransferase TuaH